VAAVDNMEAQEVTHKNVEDLSPEDDQKAKTDLVQEREREGGSSHQPSIQTIWSLWRLRSRTLTGRKKTLRLFRTQVPTSPCSSWRSYQSYVKLTTWLRKPKSQSQPTGPPSEL